MFVELTGDQVLLRTKGVSTVHDLYEMDGELYARVGSGYVRLKSNGSTSKDGQKMVKLVTNRPLWADQFERLVLRQDAAPKTKRLELNTEASGDNAPLLIAK